MLCGGVLCLSLCGIHIAGEEITVCLLGCVCLLLVGWSVFCQGARGYATDCELHLWHFLAIITGLCNILSHSV